MLALMSRIQREIDLKNAALDHDLHAIWGNASALVDSLLKRGRRKVGVERDVVYFSRMLNLDGYRRHRLSRCREGIWIVWRESKAASDAYASEMR